MSSVDFKLPSTVPKSHFNYPEEKDSRCRDPPSTSAKSPLATLNTRKLERRNTAKPLHLHRDHRAGCYSLSINHTTSSPCARLLQTRCLLQRKSRYLRIQASRHPQQHVLPWPATADFGLSFKPFHLLKPI